MRVYVRRGMLYLDTSLQGKRIRKATGLEDTPQNRAKLAQISKRELQSVLKNAPLPRQMWAQPTPRAKVCQKLEKIQKNAPLRPKNFDVGTIFTKAPPTMMLSELIARMKLEWQGLKPTTQATYQAKLSKVANALKNGKDIALNQITREDVGRFYDVLIAKNYTKAQFHSLTSLLKRMFNYAQEIGAMSQSPFFKRKITTHKPSTESKPLCLDEVAILLRNCKDEQFRAFLQVAFFTGMRTGELFALKWDCIDFEQNLIHIHAAMTANGATQSPKTKHSKRTIDMLPIVKSALLSLKGSNDKGFVFIGEQCAKDMKSYRTKWHFLLEVCELEDRILYNTRHSFASIMLSAGENPLWVGCKMLGHKDLNITYASYARFLYGEKVQRAQFLSTREDIQ